MTPLSEYLNQIEKALHAGDATEHTHRPALKALIESLSKGLTATNEPKHIACGAPDFIVTKAGVPLGYIECKDVGEPLDKVERGEQMVRYFSLGNVLLTDYLEFRWYVLGERRLSGRLASVGAKDKLKPEKDGAEQVDQLLKAFIDAEVPTVGTPKELAERMAALAQLIRDIIERALDGEDKTGPLHQQMESFREVLLHELSNVKFADMYAQTICYGLFAARCNAKPGVQFTREHAVYDLPKTNPFLRKMFDHIAGLNLDERIAWVVDDLAELLNRSRIEDILRDFGKLTQQKDPIIHFYETFLDEYDPIRRREQGVYYTPEAVVSYIVRSVDSILKRDFGLKEGLSCTDKITTWNPNAKTKSEVHKVLILDPAAGTGTFLYEVIKQIQEQQFEKGQKGAWRGYVSEHLLPRLFGFEIQMAPYAVAHMRLGFHLKDTGFDFKDEERLRFYLTDTLGGLFLQEGVTHFAQWLSEEANAASEVKKEVPVMVVLGNPPYYGKSINKGPWITQLLRGVDPHTRGKTSNYFEVDGKPLGERNPKWLNDDYVKFIRFAQWRIEQTGFGILAFITNHGYLDNPTFRGMRQCLMRTFDEIYVLDLHGNIRKKERCPDGSKDENVFYIQQGVAISIFVKRNSVGSSPPLEKVGMGNLPSPANVRHADLYGLREAKYKWLGRGDVKDTKWVVLKPQSPLYLFVPHQLSLMIEYERGYKVSDIFPVLLLGPNSHRDHFAIAFTREEAAPRIADLADSSLTDEDLRRKYDLKDNRDWSLRAARQFDFKGIKPIQCIYRPFDFRFMLYGYFAFDYHRPEINNHLQLPNLALISTRQTKEDFSILVTGMLAGQHKLATPYDGSYLSPLYLYADISRKGLFDKCDNKATPLRRSANLSHLFLSEFAVRLKSEYVLDGKGDLEKTFGPGDVFDYMYAVFHSPMYRKRYAVFLKTDFPRLPLISNEALFRELCALGGELVALHLMEKRGPELTVFPVKGDDVVEAVRYTEPGQGAKKGRVWINKTQYFEGIPPEVWNFHIGGYQVCQRWLKDRKERTLSYDDIQHYQHTVSALSETIRLMAEIDKTITQHGGWPLQ